MENVRVHKIVRVISNRKISEVGENKVEQVAIVAGIIIIIILPEQHAGKARHKEPQKTAILSTTHILREVMRYISTKHSTWGIALHVA
jgi:hypothetical protein